MFGLIIWLLIHWGSLQWQTCPPWQQAYFSQCAVLVHDGTQYNVAIGAQNLQINVFRQDRLPG